MGNYAKGKFAQNLIKWNLDNLTNLEYKKDFRRLGVILEEPEFSTTLGFCTILVAPMEQCWFKD
jgi:hypothetical protein